MTGVLSGSHYLVYVLEVGAYENRGIEGIFRTAEAAKQAHPHGTWTYSEYGWENGLGDADDSASIFPYPVKS